jgi:uncharacterized damage-inducible protein DinB
MDKNVKEISCISLLGYWHEIRESIRECLRRTPDGLLPWKPKEKMLTFGQLYVHVSTSIDWWLTNFVKDGGRWIPSGQHRTDDRRLLDEHLTSSFTRLIRYSQTPDLSQPFKNDRGEEITGNWLLLHLFEHDIHHRGQLKTYLRLNGIAPPVD